MGLVWSYVRGYKRNHRLPAAFQELKRVEGRNSPDMGCDQK